MSTACEPGCGTPQELPDCLSVCKSLGAFGSVSVASEQTTLRESGSPVGQSLSRVASRGLVLPGVECCTSTEGPPAGPRRCCTVASHDQCPPGGTAAAKRARTTQGPQELSMQLLLPAASTGGRTHHTTPQHGCTPALTTTPPSQVTVCSQKSQDSHFRASGSQNTHCPRASLAGKPHRPTHPSCSRAAADAAAAAGVAAATAFLASMQPKQYPAPAAATSVLGPLRVADQGVRAKRERPGRCSSAGDGAMRHSCPGRPSQASGGHLLRPMVTTAPLQQHMVVAGQGAAEGAHGGYDAFQAAAPIATSHSLHTEWQQGPALPDARHQQTLRYTSPVLQSSLSCTNLVAVDTSQQGFDMHQQAGPNHPGPPQRHSLDAQGLPRAPGMAALRSSMQGASLPLHLDHAAPSPRLLQTGAPAQWHAAFGPGPASLSSPCTPHDHCVSLPSQHSEPEVLHPHSWSQFVGSQHSAASQWHADGAQPCPDGYPLHGMASLGHSVNCGSAPGAPACGAQGADLGACSRLDQGGEFPVGQEVAPAPDCDLEELLNDSALVDQLRELMETDGLTWPAS